MGAELELPGCGRQAEGPLCPRHGERTAPPIPALRAAPSPPGAQLRPCSSGLPTQAPGAASPLLACARSSCEVRVAPRTRQERVPSRPQGCAPPCQPGPVRQTLVHIHPPRWQGKVAGSQAVREQTLPCLRKSRCSPEPLSPLPRRARDASFAQVPPSQFVKAAHRVLAGVNWFGFGWQTRLHNPALSMGWP